ncbi:glutathione S-transferase N-terminal domain-containing protein [Shewanella pealeana]|uniref:Glutathione S-transferase domain n=1 Tax=Shewanella pealeana (strain ATCC 700345 / ANG-SQ1) TaxID=398579 RepID=A8H663_SHEPA|nr:glutathione S-transferase N-terminal domain-containing protein [Shewanella pealeana]ABV88050.1 Glutathione S-transferase domain [Shewanella pealeana ATCC 700345]
MSAESINPVLYSLRNCPYAMRARMAIYQSGQAVQLRELCLDSKPVEFLTASPKGTVPVLVLPNGEVFEQSLEIMRWAFGTHDPDNYLISDNSNKQQQMLRLIKLFDEEFISSLEIYRSAKRYHDESLQECREACEQYLQLLEQRLLQHRYLFSDNPSLADLAIIPFIRQLARVERQWYLNSPYPKVRNWLNGYLQSLMFSKVMAKFPLWSANDVPVIFKAE